MPPEKAPHEHTASMSVPKSQCTAEIARPGPSTEEIPAEGVPHVVVQSDRSCRIQNSLKRFSRPLSRPMSEKSTIQSYRQLGTNSEFSPDRHCPRSITFAQQEADPL
uniref:Uncharacterized protein n=1 Tax=Octopus bimaculoides TaxID=37653 RepID=A0A0L8FMV3_OCTBM